MSDLAPFVAATVRDKVVEDLQEEIRRQNEKNDELRERVNNLSELNDAFSQHQQFVSVTGPGGSPLYSTGIDRFGRQSPRPIELRHYDNGNYCRSVDELLDAELHIMGGNDKKHTYCVSNAERIVCANVLPNLQHRGGADLIGLDISFDHDESTLHLVAVLEVLHKETPQWTELDIENIGENPGQIEDLRDCRLVEDEAGEPKGIHFAWVKW